MAELLDAIEIETGPNPDAAIIWLHGLGDDGHGWSAIVEALELPEGLAARFLFPHAPVMPVSINNGMAMPAWYDIRDVDFNSRADLAGVRRSQGLLEALIEREVSRGIRAERIVIAGFSQGAAVALHTSLRFGQRLAGVIALSGYLVDAASLDNEAAPCNRDLPVFMAHGTYDPVVRFEWGEGSMNMLRKAGWDVEWHAYPMEHAAVPEEIDAVGQFLRRLLAPDSADG
ncbi:MAG: alpha/beta fold hydrolase [Gammaproteobacteria bacterium]|nr:alpha/beta fold hydrolase [Gammaproteobacteria bacterium]